MTDSVLYFAYGSNMALARLRARVPSARRKSNAVLPGHRLLFHKASEDDGSAKCDAYRTDPPEDAVIGVLFTIECSDLEALDCFEGCGYGYDRQEVAVTTDSGQEVHAQTYLATDIDPNLAPFDWYKFHVLQGACENRFPEAYIAAVEGVVAIEDTDQERSTRELAVHR